MSRIPEFLRTRRRLVARPWGGDRLAQWLGSDFGTEQPIGESWEIFDRGGSDSSPLVGSGAGASGFDMSLGELMRDEETAVAILGRARLDRFGRFPLVLKFLAAREKLSLQVHPTSEMVERKGLVDAGKSEAWFVLDAADDSWLVRGLKQGFSPNDLFACLEKGEDVMPLLNVFTVRSGDVIEIPAGTVHCVGPGTLLYELQENSDLTFRLSDWHRLGLDGKPRALHLELAKEAMSDGSPGSEAGLQESLHGRQSLLLESSSFSLSRLRCSTPLELLGEGSFALLTLLEGSVRLASKTSSIELSRAQTCLISAKVESFDFVPLGEGCAIALLARPTVRVNNDKVSH